MHPHNTAAPAAAKLGRAIRSALKSDPASPPSNRIATKTTRRTAAASRAQSPERRSEARRIAAEEAGGILRGGGLLRPRHMAALLGVSASTLWQMVRDDRLPAPAHLGARCTVWTAAAVREVLARLSGEAAQ